MQKKFLSFAFIAAMLLTGFAFTSCDDDDDDIRYDYESVISFENVISMKEFVRSGTFAGSSTDGIIMPGQSATITFSAAKGQYLMFATMYAYSNDLFFAPENPGLQLFQSDGTPITGDVSDKMHLWDNGTRINEQPSAEVVHPGTAQDGVITKIETQDAQGNLYRDASELVKLNLSFDTTTSVFTLTITNNTGGTINETPLSAGVWAVSNIYQGDLVKANPFFEAGKKPSAQLTYLVESGNNAPLSQLSGEMTGIITTLSPAVVVVYTGDINPLYQLNQKDAGIGLKELAQTGDASKLRSSLNGMANVRNVYIVGDGSIGQGQKAEVTVKALENDKIAYATMFGYSNDWFYTNSETINANYKGDLTSKTILLDNGTAVNQYPGAGYSQHVFGGTAIAEDNNIAQVGNTYPIPSVANVIKVTIQ